MRPAESWRAAARSEARDAAVTLALSALFAWAAWEWPWVRWACSALVLLAMLVVARSSWRASAHNRRVAERLEEDERVRVCRDVLED